MNLDKTTFRINQASTIGKGLLVAGIAGLVISLVGLFTPSLKEQFFHSYLTSLVFWMTIGFGGLFFTMLHHLTNAVWSIVLRRIIETVMISLPVLFILFIIVLLPGLGGIEALYTWSDQELVHTDHLLHQKSVWLNPMFFTIRAVIYFLIVFFLGRTLYKLSLKEDEQGYNEKSVGLMKNISGPGMVLFALVLTFSAFDWVMSLDYLWYSTIFGVYLFAGCVVAVLSFITLLSLFLRSRGCLDNEITVEHYHDLGKLLFGFIVFWAYIAFCQFFLIWYGNIPEETDWFVRRFEGTWGTVGLLILFGHFFIPFLLLISRVPKRRPGFLGFMCVWMLLMHWVDIHWLIMPSLHTEGFAFSWLDLTTFLGIGGIFLWLFWRRLVANPIVPVNDPRLEASFHFTNT